MNTLTPTYRVPGPELARTTQRHQAINRQPPATAHAHSAAYTAASASCDEKHELPHGTTHPKAASQTSCAPTPPTAPAPQGPYDVC